MIISSLIKELRRDLSKLSETLLKIATSVDDDVVDKKEKPIKKEEVKEVGQTESTVSIEDIRAILAEKSQAGLTSKVKELLESFGAAKLSAVKPEDYEKLLKQAKELKE